jgi:hypothetical protein
MSPDSDGRSIREWMLAGDLYIGDDLECAAVRVVNAGHKG